jgi:uncharacterized cupin superfamily protein
MSAAHHVFISGATGLNATGINGAYYSTGETSDGHPLLIKRGDASMLMEHFGGKWHVKRVSAKGTASCYAYVAGGCALAACTSRQWTVSFDGKTHSDAPGLKMETGAEAERKVSGCCLRAHQHALFPPRRRFQSLPVTLVAQGAEYAAAEATAVAHDNARTVPVFISGATGVYAAWINGFFDPTQEKGPDGRLILSKRGDAGVLMEHFGGKWQVKAVSDKGKDVCYATVAGGCALAACTSRQWIVSFDGKTHSDAPGVKMETGAEVSCSRTRVRVPRALSPSLLSTPGCC